MIRPIRKWLLLKLLFSKGTEIHWKSWSWFWWWRLVLVERKTLRIDLFFRYKLIVFLVINQKVNKHKRPTSSYWKHIVRYFKNFFVENQTTGGETNISWHWCTHVQHREDKIMNKNFHQRIISDTILGFFWKKMSL